MARVSLSDLWSNLYDNCGPERFRWSEAELRDAWRAIGRPVEATIATAFFSAHRLIEVESPSNMALLKLAEDWEEFRLRWLQDLDDRATSSVQDQIREDERHEEEERRRRERAEQARIRAEADRRRRQQEERRERERAAFSTASSQAFGLAWAVHYFGMEDLELTHDHVNAAYRRLSMVVHPDRHAGAADDVLLEAHRAMALANEARTVLLNHLR